MSFYDEFLDDAPDIRIVGLGGSGNNAVTRMVQQGLTGVETISLNCNLQKLNTCVADRKILIGENYTHGDGTGGDVELAYRAIASDAEKIAEAISGADMVIIATGLGGGFGTAGSIFLAELAGKMNILTVAVVQKPFFFEGKRKQKMAEWAVSELEKKADTVIVIPNDRLLKHNQNFTMLEAFNYCDSVLYQTTAGISNLITKVGEINVDFADVKVVLKESGTATVGIASGSISEGLVNIARKAVESNLIEVPVQGAKRALLVFTGNRPPLLQISAASEFIRDCCHPDANIIFGTVLDSEMGDNVEIMVIATDMKERKEEVMMPPVRNEQRIDSAKTVEMGEIATRRTAEVKIDFQDLDTPAYLRNVKKGS